MNKTAWRYLPLSLLLITLDQITKLVASFSLTFSESIVILPIFKLTLVHNSGAAFSLLADAGDWKRIALVSVSLLASVFILAWMRKTSNSQRLLSISLSLILAGAVGNLIDRLMLGYVVDFLHLHWQNYHWPVFNAADSFIFIGAVLLVLEQFQQNRSKLPTQDTSQAEKS